MRLCDHARDYSAGISGGKRFFVGSAHTRGIFRSKDDRMVVECRLASMWFTMKKALVIGASGGIGSAISVELNARGYGVAGLSRASNGLDITDEKLVAAALQSLSGPFDVVVVATGVLASANRVPEKSLSSIEAEQMADLFAANCIGPSLVLRHLSQVLDRERPPRIGVLSARVGSIGDNKIGGWHSYRASKAALNQFVRGAAIEFARTHKGSICVALHPGTVQTPFTANYAGRHKTVPAEKAASALVDVLLGLAPSQTGKFFDYSGKEVSW